MQTILVAQTMMVLGAQLPDRFVFPIYYMLHLVSIAHIIERIELILVTMWLSGMFVKSALYLYISSEAAAQSLGLRSLRVPAVVFTAAGIALSQIWRNLLDLIHWTSSPSWVIGVVGFELGFPVLLLLASLIRPAHTRGGSANA